MELYPIAAVILAGGASRRMQFPKALLTIRGETFLDNLIRTFHGECEPVIAVLGHETDRIRSGIRLKDQVEFVVNPRPERGQLTSLQCALAALPLRCEAVMFTPVDYPVIQRSTVIALKRGIYSSDAVLAIPRHNGRRGHPVCATRPVIQELLALPEDGSARDVIHANRNRTVYVDVDDPGIASDVDDQEAYRRLQALAEQQ